MKVMLKDDILVLKGCVPMELLQLKYFCDAAETQNFSKTAQKFLVPPSNISQSIKGLEKELGQPLFTRTANKVELNAAGAAFYKDTKAALSLLNAAVDTLQQKEEHPTIKINIHVNRRVVMNAIERYRKSHPFVSFITSHALDLSANDFDIVVTDKRLSSPFIQSKATEERLLLAYHQNAYHFDKIEDLHEAPFITMNQESSMYAYTHDICRDLGFVPQIVLQSEDPFYIRKCIELGLGVCIVPELSWRGQFSDDIRLRSLGNYKRTTFLYRKNTVQSAVQEFYDILLSNFSK